MPATTPGGLPYPLGTDLVVDGDDAIRNLATAVDARLTFPGASYPAPIVGTKSTTRPLETWAYNATVATNASGDGDIAPPAGVTLVSLYGVQVIGRGSTPFQITGFLYGTSTLTNFRVRLWNGPNPAVSTSIGIVAFVTGQRS